MDLTTCAVCVLAGSAGGAVTGLCGPPPAHGPPVAPGAWPDSARAVLAGGRRGGAAHAAGRAGGRRRDRGAGGRPGWPVGYGAGGGPPVGPAGRAGPGVGARRPGGGADPVGPG